MADYVKKTIQIEAHQWDGSVPFRPTETFTPNIQPEDPDYPRQRELILSRSLLRSSILLNKNCYILKDQFGSYSAMAKDTFEATYEKAKEDETSIYT